MNNLNENCESKDYKEIFSNIVLKELVKDKPDIPIGDFGCLRREKHSGLDLQGDLYECIENYLLNYYNKTYEEKKIIKKSILIYYYKDRILGFPHEEWLNHPKAGNFHSGSSFGYCRNLIMSYFVDYDFKNVWQKLNNI
jgi:hypothetical protein